MFRFHLHTLKLILSNCSLSQIEYSNSCIKEIAGYKLVWKRQKVENHRGLEVNGFEGHFNYFIGDQAKLAITQVSWDQSNFGAAVIA